MPATYVGPEIAGNAGPVNSYTLNPQSDRVRVYGAGRTITVKNNGPGTVRHATVANDGTLGTWTDVASGSSLTVATTETRDVLLLGPGSAALGLTYA